MILNEQEFSEKLAGIRDFAAEKAVAVAVSGGPDSMALCWLLSRWAAQNDVTVHAFTVDHGLRAESADEARQVGAWVNGWPRVTHRILTWEGAKPEARILEEARAARYNLMAEAMKETGCHSLFVAHHRDDQAETFLIRLAKGSGLDGLSGMRTLQSMEGGQGVLVRPLLDVSKDDIIQMCDANKISYVNDPTNKNEKYLRPRLRAAKEALEEEGLSAKRLAVTARRLARAKEALDDMAQDLFVMAMKEERDDGFLFDYRMLHTAHEELVLRVCLKAMDSIRHEADYGPRMERLESLLERILKDSLFKSATLGGCLFAIDRKNGTLWIGKE